MQSLSWRVRDDEGEEKMQSGSVAELCWALPSFPAAAGTAGGVPPYASLRRLLGRGKDETATGAGVRWTPINLTEDDYFELAEALAGDERIKQYRSSEDADEFELEAGPP